MRINNIDFKCYTGYSSNRKSTTFKKNTPLKTDALNKTVKDLALLMGGSFTASLGFISYGIELALPQKKTNKASSLCDD